MISKRQKHSGRFTNKLFYYKVERRSEQCIACGTYAWFCEYGVHRRRLGFSKMEEPESYLCAAPLCNSCVEKCPQNALEIRVNSQLQAIGDLRWTPELILSTYEMAETGKPPVFNLADNGRGRSGGGFDLMEFDFSQGEIALQVDPEQIDLSESNESNESDESYEANDSVDNMDNPFPLFLENKTIIYYRN